MKNSNINLLFSEKTIILERKLDSQNFRKSPLRQSNKNRTRLTRQENKRIRILQNVLDQLKTCQSKDSEDFCDVSFLKQMKIDTQRARKINKVQAKKS